MQVEIPYRDYTIFHDGCEFVAEVEKPDDDVVFEMGSSSVDALIDAINELHDANAAKIPVPVWFHDWMNRGCEGRAKVQSLRERLQIAAAAGRIPRHLITAGPPELEAIEVAPRRSQAARCGWVFGIFVLMLALLPVLARALDLDQDNVLSRNDLRIAASIVALRLLPERMTRVVHYRGRDLKATFDLDPVELATGGRVAITLHDISSLVDGDGEAI